MKHLITREIGIDAGHRVTYHGSKCRNLHGHRYTVSATCVGGLAASGEEEGMVLDFGFLKEEMMQEIDEPCDHGMILWEKDPILKVLAPSLYDSTPIKSSLAEKKLSPQEMLSFSLQEWGHFSLPRGKLVSSSGKVYIVPFVPTAENLAKHWFERLSPRVIARTGGRARLLKIKVYETPNCSAEYPA